VQSSFPNLCQEQPLVLVIKADENFIISDYRFKDPVELHQVLIQGSSQTGILGNNLLYIADIAYRQVVQGLMPICYGHTSTLASHDTARLLLMK